MQGVFNNRYERFKSKKALREAVAAGDRVTLEATSWFGNEYDGALDLLPDGDYYIAGPNPHTDRRWYAHIVKRGEKVTVK